MNDIAISVKNLTKTYRIFDHPGDRIKQAVTLGQVRFHREFTALKNISFELRKGETLGIIGRNGSGKSTLLQLICGILKPTSGTVRVNGRISALLELGAGFNPEFTGCENVYFQGALTGFTKEQMDERFDEIAAFADIGDFMQQPVQTYSSGMYARLAFSASMFLEPDILIVDEILAVGDAPFQAKCVKEFHNLRDLGCSVIMVSHDEYMVKSFCQKALYLSNGNSCGFGDSARIVDEYSQEAGQGESKILNAIGIDRNDGTPNCAQTEGGLFRIASVELCGSDSLPTRSVRTGQSFSVFFKFDVFGSNPPKVTFAVNLYRHDGLYICGATSIMDKYPPFQTSPDGGGSVRILFSEIRLLAGRYNLRVAINDERGFAAYVEANRVCSFVVTDNLEAVGLFNLDRTWSISCDEN